MKLLMKQIVGAIVAVVILILILIIFFPKLFDSASKFLGLKFELPETEIIEELHSIQNITLSTDKETAISQLVAETLTCWEHFQENNFENIHCIEIIIPSDFVGEITERAFCKALDNSGPLGNDLAGAGICGVSLTRENYEWQIDTLKAGLPLFYICGDNSGGNELFLTRNLNQCPLKT